MKERNEKEYGGDKFKALWGNSGQNSLAGEDKCSAGAGKVQMMKE